MYASRIISAEMWLFKLCIDETHVFSPISSSNKYNIVEIASKDNIVLFLMKSKKFSKLKELLQREEHKEKEIG